MIGKFLIGGVISGAIFAQAATDSGAFPGAGSAQAVGWLALTAFAILGGIKMALDVWHDHFKTKPDPASTYETNEAAKEARKTIIEKLEKLETTLVSTVQKFNADITEVNRYQSAARQPIHAKLNRHENALYFLAGKEERDGDSRAGKIIRERLESKDGGHGG